MSKKKSNGCGLVRVCLSILVVSLRTDTAAHNNDCIYVLFCSSSWFVVFSLVHDNFHYYKLQHFTTQHLAFRFVPSRLWRASSLEKMKSCHRRRRRHRRRHSILFLSFSLSPSLPLLLFFNNNQQRQEQYTNNKDIAVADDEQTIIEQSVDIQ